MSLTDAQAGGYDPCKVCKPSGYSASSQTSNTSSQQENKEYTVNITKTGSKYHLDGCRYLSRSQIPIDLSAAKASGYDPCSVCGPPN